MIVVAAVYIDKESIRPQEISSEFSAICNSPAAKPRGVYQLRRKRIEMNPEYADPTKPKLPQNVEASADELGDTAHQRRAAHKLILQDPRSTNVFSARIGSVDGRSKGCVLSIGKGW